MTKEQELQIRTMRRQGLGYVKIGQALDISHNTVRSFCRRNGLESPKAQKAAFCQQCGKRIKTNPKRKQKKFCSDSCRAAWWNSHLDKVQRKAVYTFTCAGCGSEFTAYGNKQRKYCSHDCYISDRFGKVRGCDG